MIGQQSFKRVSQEVDEEQPQRRCKQDGTQHRLCLHWHMASAQEKQNTAFINKSIYKLSETEKWLTVSLAQ